AEPARFRLLSEQAETLEFVGGKDHEQLNLFYGGGEMERVTGVVISGGAFRHLPAQPLLGRVLTAADSAPGALPVVLIRESLWRSRFGRRTAVIGSTLNVAGTERTIVGVLPDTFEFPNSPRVWVPLEDQTLGGTAEAMARGVEIFGIRSSQSTWQAAQQEVSSLSHQFERATAGAQELRLGVVPYTEAGREGLWALATSFVVVLVLVLLVIAANVGHLMLVRSASRGPELAVRTALGAPRERLVGQLFTEVALLVVLASGLAFAAAHAALGGVRQMMDEAPFWIQFSASPRTLLASAGVMLLATLAAGLAPALVATRSSVARRMGRHGSTRELGRLGSGLTVAEMALAVALVGAALVIARGALDTLQPGFELPAEEILTAHMRLVQPKPPAGLDLDVDAWRAASIAETRSQVFEAMRALPGVVAVGGTSSLPGDSTHPWPSQIEPLLPDEPSRALEAPVVSVLPGYFEALGVAPTTGRSLNAGDAAEGAPPVVVVNQPFVDRHFAGRNPIGRRLRLLSDGDADASPWREIVGVVPDLGLSVANPELAAGFYVPMGSRRFVDLAVRVEGLPMHHAEALQQAVSTVDPAITLRRIQPLADITRQAAFNLSALSAGLMMLGGTALLLSLVGMFALTSLAVARRTREIGIRAALGASSQQILDLVMRRAVRHSALGAAFGALLGALVFRAIRSLESGLPHGGLWELAAIALMLAGTGCLACWIPARRALRVDPAEALRAE
ncbi:MAG: ABC transporter permease, partial [Acidobacteriota bacterium]